MGMTGNILRVSKEELEAYIKDSALLENRIYSENGYNDPKLLDLDKSWEGIFFMLTGKGIAEMDIINSPLIGIIFSEKIIDEGQDLGYGPANYLEPEEVKILNKELQDISREEFEKKYQPDVMNDLNIYPPGWGNGQDDLEYLVEYFIKLKAFYETAAKEENCVINFIN